MRAFIIRCVLTAGLLFFTYYLFYTGYWGWGIFLILITAIVGATFVINENVALAINNMRKGDQVSAAIAMNRITHPQLLPRRQHAYVIYMQALLNAQSFGHAKSEMLLRKAIGLGLKRGHDQAMARMHLAGICAQTGRRQESITLLAEAKKLDNSGMLKEQIKMMQGQLQQTPSKNQMRMAQMMGGRKKTPRSR